MGQFTSVPPPVWSLAAVLLVGEKFLNQLADAFNRARQYTSMAKPKPL